MQHGLASGCQRAAWALQGRCGPGQQDSELEPGDPESRSRWQQI